MNGRVALSYFRQILGPSLHRGNTIVMDNLPADKTRQVRAAIKAVGARRFYLPPYSPDMYPIEMPFSKLKALLRQNPQRTVDALGGRPKHSSISSRPGNAPTSSRPKDMYTQCEIALVALEAGRALLVIPAKAGITCR